MQEYPKWSMQICNPTLSLYFLSIDLNLYLSKPLYKEPSNQRLKEYYSVRVALKFQNINVILDNSIWV